MKKIYTSYGDIGSMGMYVARPSVGFYGYEGHEDLSGYGAHAIGETVRYSFAIHRTEEEARRVMDNALQGIRARGWIIHETGIVIGNDGMFYPWAMIERTAESVIPDIGLWDTWHKEEEEKKTNWVPWAIGGAVVGGIVLTGIIVAVTRKKKKFRR